MRKRYIIYAILLVFASAALAGCGTTAKKKDEISGIKSRVDTLESRVDSVEAKQTELAQARMAEAQAYDEAAERERQAKTNISVKLKDLPTRERTKAIQTCLKNAGFYKGKVDGVKGKKTKRAIKEFQKAHGLKVDGIVGRKTWDALIKYAGSDAKDAAAEGVDK
jgi:outer membrane murein-binding lipoprotein Lpp